MLQKSKSRLLLPIFLVLVILYVITRISDNVASWKVASSPANPAETTLLSPSPTPSVLPAVLPAATATPAPAGAEDYARILIPPADDQKILALWKLTQSPDWIPTAAGVDPLPLAKEIARRAAAYYTASNFAQAASHVQILLRWSIRLLTSPEADVEGDKKLSLAKIAVATAATCPNTLLYPAIQTELRTLSEAVVQRRDPTVEELLTKYADPLANKETGSWKIFANKDVLRSLLLEYVTTPPEMQDLQKTRARATLKSILLLCPRTVEMFNLCLTGLNQKDSEGESLKTEIQSLMRNIPSPPAAPQPVPAS